MQEKLASKNIVLKKITTNDVTRKYLSWFKDRQTKKFIENSKSIKNILDLKKNIKFESSKENSYFFKIITKSGIHIGNVKIENNLNTNTSTLGILIGEKKYDCTPDRRLHNELGTRIIYRRLVERCNKKLYKQQRRRAMDNPHFRFDR